MDLSELNVSTAAETGAPVELLHPGTGEPLGITLTVRGFEAPEVEEAARDYSRALMRRAKKPEASEALAGRRRAQAKACLMAVEGGSGKSETVADFHRMIDTPGFVWVIEQIEAVAGDRASFFRSAETP